MSTRLTERQFFFLSLTGVLLLVFALYMGLLRPRLQLRANLRAETERLTSELRQAGFLLGEGTLIARKDDLERDLLRRLEEWDDLTRRLTTFRDTDLLGDEDVANIDYKFQLFATRARLGAKAAEQRIEVPVLLGLPDEIESDDIARELMLQLRAVETLVDTAIEYGIADIRSIDPLPPVRHTAGPTQTVFMEEYPLRVIFEGDMPRLYRLWEAMFQPAHAMMLRNVAMEKTALNRPQQVRMTATLSAFLFVSDARDIRAEAADPTARARPRGF